MEQGHLEAQDLARLAEGAADDAARERAAEHLAHCRRCAAVYADFVRAGLDTSFGVTAAAGDDWVRLGLSVASAPAASRHSPWRGARVWGPAFALVLLGIGGFWSTRKAGVEIPAATRFGLEQLVRADSYESLLYSADYLPAARGTRGNAESSNDSLVGAFCHEFAPQIDDPDVAFWLVAGSLAGIQLTRADGYLRKVSPAFPNDPRFENLAAILDYKRGKLESAETHLRAAMQRDRTGVARVNLIRLLDQLGRHREAQELDAGLRRDRSGARLAAQVEQATKPTNP